ncbi:MAG: hypothetical protein GY928_35630, partial [Colwellia sp.]|nr:hypothetical protein [Colwellia sp.]
MAFKPDPQLVGKAIGSGFGNAKTLLDIVEHKMDRNKLQGIADQMRAGNFEDAGAGLVGIDRIASGLNTMNIPVQRQQ